MPALLSAINSKAKKTKITDKIVTFGRIRRRSSGSATSWKGYGVNAASIRGASVRMLRRDEVTQLKTAVSLSFKFKEERI